MMMPLTWYIHAAQFYTLGSKTGTLCIYKNNSIVLVNSFLVFQSCKCKHSRIQEFMLCAHMDHIQRERLKYHNMDAAI